MPFKPMNSSSYSPVSRAIKIALFSGLIGMSAAQANLAAAPANETSSVAVTQSAVAGPYTNAPATQVLAQAGDQKIYAMDLEQALSSSPISTTFLSMDEDNQARVRGDMLQRLITAKLIYLEAIAQKIPDTEAYHQEMASYRTSLLAQRYLDQLRNSVVATDDIETKLKERLKGDADAQEAAMSAYVAQHYPQLRDQRMAELRDQYQMKEYPERILPNASSDTVVAEANGITITLGQLHGGLDATSEAEQISAMKDRLSESIDVTLMARAAVDAGINVDVAMEDYGRNLAARLLMRNKQQQWVPSEQAKRDWFEQHPDVGEIPTRWHVGQIVLKTREEAEAVLKRIEAGESLFNLAGELSIDPYGRDKNGDMGWYRAGQGLPTLEAALKSTEDGKISDIVETPMGFHIMTVLERRPGSQKTYADVHDRVAQAMVAEKLPDFLVGLEHKFGVTLAPNDDRAPESFKVGTNP